MSGISVTDEISNNRENTGRNVTRRDKKCIKKKKKVVSRNSKRITFVEYVEFELKKMYTSSFFFLDCLVNQCNPSTFV